MNGLLIKTAGSLFRLMLAAAMAITVTGGDRLSLSPKVGAILPESPAQLASDEEPLFTFHEPYKLVVSEPSASGSDPMKPLSLASADFDEDGVPDLVSGHLTVMSGLVLLHRGNAGAIYPDQGQSGKPQPFFPDVVRIEMPVPPEFLFAGDIDGDGHHDLITAARGVSSIYWRRGDGRGGFGSAAEIVLPGTVQDAAAARVLPGEGAIDLSIAVDTGNGSSILIFRNVAKSSTPDLVTLPVRVNAIACGRLNGDAMVSVAAASSDHLLIIRQDVGEPVIERHDLGSPIRSIVIGDFNGRGLNELLIMTAAGSFRMDSSGIQTLQSKTPPETSQLPGQEMRPVSGRLSSRAGESLIIVDGSRLHLIADALTPQTPATSLSIGADVTAILPMRLNADALSDLVILESGNAPIRIIETRAQNAFAVTNINDGGSGSLRQALLDANAAPGSDSISFNIQGSGPHRIVINSELPLVGDGITIDGTTQPGFVGVPLIEISASDIGYTNGLRLWGSNCTVRGLILNTLSVERINTAGNIIEGNYVGVNSLGQAPTGQFPSFGVNGSASCIVGGTMPQARNLLSSGASVIGSNGSRVLGNYIGVNVTGGMALENPFGRQVDGLTVYSCRDVVIGGSVAGAGNLISGNPGSGLKIWSSQNTRIEGNLIGTSIDGSGRVGNLGHGILIDSNATDTQIGVPQHGNIIAYNGRSGVFLDSGSYRNSVRGNSIFDNAGLGIDWSLDGVDQNFIDEAGWDPVRKQNFPVLSLATNAGGGLTVKGELNSHPNSSFMIDFYSITECDPTGYGEGRQYLGSAIMTTDGRHTGRFTATLPVSVGTGRFITAVAIRDGGTTSEFSQCLPVVEGCSSIYPATDWSYNYAGGTGNVGIGALTDCSWTATSSAGWVTIVSRSIGTGDGLMDFVVAPNSAPFTRRAAITINGQELRIRQDGRVTAANAASYDVDRIPFEGIAAIFGSGLATRVESATSLPLPDTLAGTTVRITDPVGNEAIAPLFFVSPNQINFLARTIYAGPSRITITSGDGTVSTGPVEISYTAPGLFSANATGSGILAGYILRIRPDGSQAIEPVSRWDPVAGQNVAVPVEIGPETEAVFLIAFGTGLHGGQIRALIGDEEGQVIFAGSQGTYLGLDQVNIRLPRSLIGAGEADLRLVIGDAMTNSVKIHFRSNP